MSFHFPVTIFSPGYVSGSWRLLENEKFGEKLLWCFQWRQKTQEQIWILFDLTCCINYTIILFLLSTKLNRFLKSIIFILLAFVFFAGCGKSKTENISEKHYNGKERWDCKIDLLLYNALPVKKQLRRRWKKVDGVNSVNVSVKDKMQR